MTNKILIENNTEEVIKESNFGIRSQADLVHIFNVLRNKMYTDKILALVREYSNNAQDEHTESGKRGEPIHIHLPTSAEPYYSVRDYGRGLSEDGIRNTYAMYGASTKRGSTELNGQLGFGSKAAFSYANQYTITSFNEGKKSVYDAYIDETGLGAVSLISQTDSTEPSGIEIRVKIAASDIPVFKTKAETFFKYFNPTPKFNIPLNIVKPTYSIRREKWAIKEFVVPQFGMSPSNEIRLVMGNVSYPVDKTIISEFANKNTDKNVINSALALAIDLFVPVGSANIAASREGLEYDKKTQGTILNALRDCISEVKEDFKKQFSEASDIVQAKKLFATAKSGALSPIFNSLVTDKAFNYKGQQITNSTFIIPDRTWTETTSDNRNFTHSAVKLTKISLSPTNTSGFSRSRNASYILEANQMDKLVFADDTKPSVRTATLCKNNKSDYILVELDEEHFSKADFLRALDFPESYLKSIKGVEPLPETKKRAKTPKNNFKGLYVGAQRYNQMNWDTASEINVPTSGTIYYAEIENRQVVHQVNKVNKCVNLDLYLTFINTQFTGNAINPSRIIGVPQGLKSKIDPSWKPLLPELQSRLNEIEKRPEINTAFEKLSSHHASQQPEFMFLSQLPSIVPSEVSNFISKILKEKTLSNNETTLNSFIANLKYHTSNYHNSYYMLESKMADTLNNKINDKNNQLRNMKKDLIKDKPLLEVFNYTTNTQVVLNLLLKLKLL